MVDEHVAAQKLKEIVQRIARARALCPADPEEFAGDANAVELVSLMKLVDYLAAAKPVKDDG